MCGGQTGLPVAMGRESDNSKLFGQVLVLHVFKAFIPKDLVLHNKKHSSSRTQSSLHC